MAEEELQRSTGTAEKLQWKRAKREERRDGARCGLWRERDAQVWQQGGGGSRREGGFNFGP